MRELAAAVNWVMGLGVRRMLRAGLRSTNSRAEDATAKLFLPEGGSWGRGVTQPKSSDKFPSSASASRTSCGSWRVWRGGGGLPSGVLPIASEVLPNPALLPSNGNLLQTLVAQNSLLLQTPLQQGPSQCADLGIVNGAGGSGDGGGPGGARDQLEDYPEAG